MDLSKEKIQSIIAHELPDFQPKGKLQRLEGGNLNYVWRLNGKSKSLIVKIAPPYIAGNPEVPLSPNRIQFEAAALTLFLNENLLHSIGSSDIRPPFFTFFGAQNYLLVMEDIGDVPHIGEADLAQYQYTNLGKILGKFIAKLHSQTYGNSRLGDRFNNADIQRTRLEVQYKSAAKYAEKAGVTDTSAIRKETETLGQQLLRPGQCLVMGDLWPQSILVKDSAIRLIDWEFVHFGRPLQDIGHFAAHCWMLAHTASQKKTVESFKRLWACFWEEYQNEIDVALINQQELGDSATHIGAEILVRAIGPFKNGYVYQSFNAGEPLIREAVNKAKQLILADDFDSLWTPDIPKK